MLASVLSSIVLGVVGKDIASSLRKIEIRNMMMWNAEYDRNVKYLKFNMKHHEI